MNVNALEGNLIFMKISVLIQITQGLGNQHIREEAAKRSETRPALVGAELIDILKKSNVASNVSG
jgi:hypothetical protein